jgi:hypothetical protein
MKNINIHFGYLLGTLVAGFISWSTLTGDIQKHIHFAGTANEIGFFACSGFITICCAAYSFTKSK